MQTPDGIRFTDADGVATVTLDRPDKHNALTLEMRQFLERLPEAVDALPDVRCVVFDAVGASFCAGADLGEIAAADGTITPTNPATGIRGLTVPSIMAVHAACITGGLELALAADMIVAGRSARFADTHARMNALPRWGMAAALPRRIGAGRALEMSMTTRWVSADEAYAIGLVDVVVDDADLATRVGEVAAAIARVAPDVVAATRTLFAEADDGDVDRALAAEETAWRSQAGEPPDA